MTSPRTADHPIDPRFTQRWSPRAFDPRPITHDQLASLFEAARWAPSCLNSQPWRFVYAMRDTGDWQRFVDLLTPNNQSWAKNASALVIVASHTQMAFPGSTNFVPSPTHSFDTGAAWMQLALQAVEQGLQTHGMAGFDRERAARDLDIPSDYRVEAAIAIGWPGDKASLPEALQAREMPSPRNPISRFAFPGRFIGS
ncbi:MAG: nitroreductase family protein [Micropepsaceae bacterium]